jgi:hypothetical protein
MRAMMPPVLAPCVAQFSGLPEKNAAQRHDPEKNCGRRQQELAQGSHLIDQRVLRGSYSDGPIKQSSSRRGEGLPGDLNENVIRRLALTSGLVDVKVAALDQDWSALKLVRRKH